MFRSLYIRSKACFSQRSKRQSVFKVLYKVFLLNRLSTCITILNARFCIICNLLKLQSHYSDNQSPTSDNHFFLGGCRRLSEVGKCLSMIADLSAIGCQRITSTTSRRPPTTTFFGVFFGGIRWSANDCRWSPTSRRLVGDWLSEQLVGERFSLQHRKPFADQTSWAFAVHRPWIWIKMVWAFSTHIVYFRFARPQARENRWCAQFGMSAPCMPVVCVLVNPRCFASEETGSKNCSNFMWHGIGFFWFSVSVHVGLQIFVYCWKEDESIR